MESNAESSNVAELRENHRIRERMRRESMTAEDRERSLARRHYNYHQRRASTITLNGNPSSENTHGRIKINTDGSCLTAHGQASFGGLARNDQGMWIEGFCGRIGPASVIAAELWGIRHGLKLAHARGWVNVDIETDSYNATDLVNGEDSVENHPERNLIEDCRNMLKDTSFKLMHTLREGNKCADTLARYGGLQREREVRILIPPNEVVEDMIADMQGTMFPRGD